MTVDTINEDHVQEVISEGGGDLGEQAWQRYQSGMSEEANGPADKASKKEETKKGEAEKL